MILDIPLASPAEADAHFSNFALIRDILVTVLLVLLNGFFVAAEFALVKIRGSQLEIVASSGNRRAKLALDIVKNLDSYLSACQLGITIASLALGSVGEPMVEDIVKIIFGKLGLDIHIHVVETISYILSLGILTTLHVVFGEQAPKMMALQSAEKVTLAVSYPMRFFYTIFGPVVWLLNSLSNVVLKSLGIYQNSHHDQHTAEELALLIDQGKATGAIEEGEHEIIKNAFGFDQIMARQIMVPRPKINGIDIDTPVEEVIVQIINEGYSRMPVYQDNIDNIEGIVYTKDLLRLMNKKEKIEFKDAMRPAYFVPETKKISDLLRDLQKKRMHMAIITDEYGGVSGIVTIEDIIEEIVGEIQDEHDDEAPIVEKTALKEYVVNALSSIIDVNEHLPEPLPEADEYETVAGYISMIFGKIPDLDDTIETKHYRISIIKKSKQMVQVVKLNLLDEPK
jgi:CBS domain containing-hemolysin-like protein